MMFLHEQNETEPILTAENLWPLSTFFKSLLFPCLRQGNNFEEGQKEGGLRENPVRRLSNSVMEWSWFSRGSGFQSRQSRQDAAPTKEKTPSLWKWHYPAHFHGRQNRAASQ